MLLFVQAPLQKSDFEIELLPWPASNPDLNAIENLWEILGKVYDREKPPIDKVVELEERIKSA